MLDCFLLKGCCLTFISYLEKDVINFSLSDEKSIEKIKKFLSSSSGILFKFDFSEVNVENFLLIYNELLKSETNNLSVSVDLSEFTDEEIKENVGLLKFLESKTSCSFLYKYDTYATASLNEVLNTIDFIEKQAEIVRYYNFSPMEALIFIFDMVRDREFVKEANEDGLDVSRNLSRVITSDEIVCDGYANLFSAIANKCGIYTEKVKWRPLDGKKFTVGHASNLCYVNDPVYNIHGFFEIDATSGRKRKNDKNRFLKNYSAFGSSIMDAKKNKKNEKNNSLVYREDNNNLINNILKLYRSYISFSKYDIVSDFSALRLVKEIEKYNCIVGRDIDDCLKVEKLISDGSDKEIIKKAIKKLLVEIILCYNLFDIYFSDLILMLYKVRRVECCIDSKKYPYSMEELYIILCNYYGKFISTIMFSFQTITELLGRELIEGSDDNLFENTLENINLDSKRMELISTLRRIKK